MSSSQRTERVKPRTGRRGPAGWSLRARLLAEQLLLVSIICIIIGASTLLFLRQFLFSQLDSQLAKSAQGAILTLHLPNGGPGDQNNGRNHFGQTPGPGPFFLSAGGTQAGVVGVSVTSSETRAGIANGFDPRNPTEPQTNTISDAAKTTMLNVPNDGRAHVVDLGGGLGQYLAQAETSQEDGSRIAIALPLSSVDSTLTQVIIVFLMVAGGGIILVGVIGGLIIRHTLRPLQRVAATAGRVAELPLDRGEVALSVRVPEVDTDPRTEVGQVGSALNRMLGHIAQALAARQASEMRVRQFVADASHELRTPLAGIRGYAELAQRSEDASPPEVVHALRRIESESARMTTLVEDLLLLARLDSGRPMERETVDLSLLVIERVGDAHVAGPEHRWQLELPDEPVTVAGDTQRLHQVLANLLNNARTHTPPGTTVTTSVTVSPQHDAVLSVVDNGPGIPPELLPKVFDRFARGDSSRSRAAGSTGLGLAIVSAVVSGHHGSVSVESRPGRTAFIVRLPGANGGQTSLKDPGPSPAEVTMPIQLPDGPPILWPTESGNTQPNAVPGNSHSMYTGSAQQSRRSRTESGRHDRARP